MGSRTVLSLVISFAFFFFCLKDRRTKNEVKKGYLKAWVKKHKVVKDIAVALTFGLSTIGLALTCMAAAAPVYISLTPFALTVTGSILTGLAFWSAVVASY
ncbi:hypothetical protein N7504_010662 [Penicillium tannophilum]|nr:hypothetical protein N7504_010662 [Penicillium tannophilum]